MLKDAPDDGRVEPIKALYLKYPRRCKWLSNTELDSNGNVKETIYAWYQKRLGYKGGWEQPDFAYLPGTYDLPGLIYKPHIDPATIKRGYSGFWKEPSTPCEEKRCNADKHPDFQEESPMEDDFTGSDTNESTSEDELEAIPQEQKTKQDYLKDSFCVSSDSEEVPSRSNFANETTDDSESSTFSEEEEGRLKIQPGAIPFLTSMHKQTIHVEPEVEPKLDFDSEIVLFFCTILVYHRVSAVQNPLPVTIDKELSVNALLFYIAEEIGKVQKKPDPKQMRLSNDFQIFYKYMKCKELVGKKVILDFRLCGGADQQPSIGSAFENAYKWMDASTEQLLHEVNKSMPTFRPTVEANIVELQLKRPSEKQALKTIACGEANILKAKQEVKSALTGFFDLCVDVSAKKAYLQRRQQDAYMKKQLKEQKMALKLQQQQQLQQLQQQQLQQQQQFSLPQQQSEQLTGAVVEELSSDDDGSH